MNLKNAKFIKVFLVISLLCCTNKSVQAISNDSKLPNNVKNISTGKVWKITFNQPIIKDSLSNNIVLKDSNGSLSNAKISLDNTEKVLMVQPPAGGYKYNEMYSLSVTDKVKSKSGQTLNKNVILNFSTEMEPIIPKISYLALSKEPVVEGEESEIYISSKNVSKVQYRVFIYDKQSKKYQELTNGYSEVKQTNKLLKIPLINSLKKGEYEIKVYAKNPNIKGIHSDYNTEFDSCDTLQFSCIKNSAEEINTEIATESSNYKIGDTVTIRGLENLDKKNNSYEYEFKVYNLCNEGKVQNILLNDKSINWKPENVGEYILELSMRVINESSYKTYKVKKIKYINVETNTDINNNPNTENNSNNNSNNSSNSTNNTGNNNNNNTNNNNSNNSDTENNNSEEHKKIIYTNYEQTISELIKIQLKSGAVTSYNSGFKAATSDDIAKYIDPKQFENDEYAIFQFLKLNYNEGATVEELNSLLKGKGVLENKGEVFLTAAKNNNVSVEYLIAHAILETGNGKSKLASGILVSKVDGKDVTPKTTYNMFGIRAYDSAPEKMGSEYAYKSNWFTVDEAIMGGAKWISNDYINNSKYKQNTLYKMRWNPETPGVHQYATDVGWAYKQIRIIKPLIDQCRNYEFNFEIPKYKE